MSNKPVFRFGINSLSTSAEATTELARKLEANGFSTLLTPDGPSRGPATFPLLAFAAAATTTLHVGTYVIANDLHHPFHLAHNAATLQTLSGGRFELGLGAGRPGMDAEYAALGLTIDSPGKRVHRLRTSATIIRDLLRGETVTHTGDDYALTDATLPGWLVAGSPPPVMIAGSGPRLLEMAAQTADAVAVGSGPMDSWEKVTGTFDRINELGTQRDPRPELNMTLNGVGDQMSGYFRSLPAEQQRKMFESDLPTILSGSTDDIVEGIHKRYEQFGVTYFILFEDLLDQMIPAVRRLAS